MPDEPTDETLMRAYAKGDTIAFERLFERYRRPLFTYLLHLTGARGPAEDLFQDVFLRLVRSRERYRANGTFRAWLFTIAHNAATDERRRAGAGAPAASEASLGASGEAEAGAGSELHRSDDLAHDPVARSHASELRERIEAALLGIPAEQREVFLLRERAGLDFAGIAEATGVHVATAKSRMRYALANLRRRLAGDVPSATECLHE